jgi:hypothetical protein
VRISEPTVAGLTPCGRLTESRLSRAATLEVTAARVTDIRARRGVVSGAGPRHIVQEGLTNALKHAGGLPRRSPSGTPAVPWRLRSPPPATAGPLRPLRRPRLSLTRPPGALINSRA